MPLADILDDEWVTGRRRLVVWLGFVIGGLLVVVFAAYLAKIGLDRADKTASVLGAFIGLAGLALSVYGVVGTRGSRVESARVSTIRKPPVIERSQVVLGGSVGHDNIQIGEARDVDIRGERHP